MSHKTRLQRRLHAICNGCDVSRAQGQLQQQQHWSGPASDECMNVRLCGSRSFAARPWARCKAHGLALHVKAPRSIGAEGKILPSSSTISRRAAVRASGADLTCNTPAPRRPRCRLRCGWRGILSIMGVRSGCSRLLFHEQRISATVLRLPRASPRRSTASSGL